MNLYSTAEMTELLRRHNFFFKKNLGQNFLVSEQIARRIAEAARRTGQPGKKTVVLEIGPGAGALTRQLSSVFDRVVAIELDSHLISVLNDSLHDLDNVTVFHQDALRFDYSALADEFCDYSFAVCSNLPYYITSEAIMTLLESKLHPENITVLIQKEAATRLVSPPASPEYGAISAVVSYYANCSKLFSVSPGNFIPRPKVDSAVLQLIPYKTPPVNVENAELMLRVIRAAFSARRKTLLNALSGALSASFSKERIARALEKSEIDPSRRGETLHLSEFALISDNLSKCEEQ